MKFSVCMSVYKNDKANDFVTAVRSVMNQTCPPSEIVLVEDGPVSDELEAAVVMLEKELPIMKVIRLPKNLGHAGARQAAMEAASNDLVAVMDADDISVPERFELQLKAFQGHPGISVVGGQIKEFVDRPDNVAGERIVPCEDVGIKAYMKARCPMNLVTVMYRKHDVQAVGGFMDWYCEEDYYLWIRLALAGKKFHNVPENLVNVRVGKEMYRRRGGWKYFKSEARLQKYMLDHKMISLPKYLYNISIRWTVQVAMPNRVRGWVFRTFARK